MEWVKIYQTPERFKAELVLAALRQRGIECREIDRKDSMYVMLGQVELFVPDEDVNKALEYLQTLEEQE